MDFCSRKSVFLSLQRRQNGEILSPVPSLSPAVSTKKTKPFSHVYKRDLLGHFGCVNAVEFSADGQLIASGGDDRRLLIWNLWKTILEDKPPLPVETLHISNINSCCFDNLDKKVATGGNDGQVIIHDINVLKSTSVYGLSDAVYCLSPDPVNSTILATASDEGKVQILDTRTADDSSPVTLADTGGSMHSVDYNIAEPRILATANSKHGIAIWDIRMPLKSLSYKSNTHNCMSARFNTRGDQLFVLRRRAPPVLYDISQMRPLYQFDHSTYYNACTLKSGCFAGRNDQYVLAGSDDFSVFVWKIPDTPDAFFTQSEPQAILRGHRSIVNQVRYCRHNQMIISSGVEKLIKVWTPYPTPEDRKNSVYTRTCMGTAESERNAYSHEEYIHMVLRAGSFLSHDYSNGNTDEEPCMIAFFDSLIQREVEQSESELSSDSAEESVDERQRERLMDQSHNSLMFDEEDDVVRRGLENAVRERLSANATRPYPPERDSAPRSSHSLPVRPEDLQSLSRMENESSSDSGSEVDEILSAMYNRYMHSRERSENQGPTGKKISSVIVQGKHKDKKIKKPVPKQRMQHIGENLQHSNDQYLRDNARNLSILADVIDNFVDNLVSNDSPSRPYARGASNNGATTSGNTSSASASTLSVLPTIPNQDAQSSSSTHNTRPSASSSSTTRTRPSQSNSSNQSTSLESGVYFIPELQAFAPQSLQAVLEQEQFRSSQPGPSSESSRLLSETVSGSAVVNHQNQNGHTSLADVSPQLHSTESNVDTNSVSFSHQNLKLNTRLEGENGKKHSPSNSHSSCSPSTSCSKPSHQASPLHSASTSSSTQLSSSPLLTTSPHVLTTNNPYSRPVKSSGVSPKLKIQKTREDRNEREAELFPSKECKSGIDSSEPVTFKKASKNKKRRFRPQKPVDSCSSSDDESD